MVREWKLRPSVSGDTLENADLPPIVARLLNSRGVTDRSELDSFLNPILHEPSLLPGMEEATDRLRSAIDEGETVGIFGDFDVDGVTSTALMAQGCTDLGLKVVPYIPDRMTEGHGLNEAAILTLREQGVSVLVTVDCGITSTKEVILAQELGMDVIITDHHVPPASLPPATAIVSSKLDRSEYPFPDLSGAGLALKLMEGLHEVLQRPWKRNLLELAALSTVADMVPLRGENRYLVREGLKELRNTHRPGLSALYRHAGVRPESIDTETISFLIAPRLNAAGRMEHASTAYRILLTESAGEADDLAAHLETLNRQRQERTAEAWARARDTVSAWDSLPAVILVSDDRLSPGIAGLVASRLVEEFHRPAIAVSIMEGVARASARSIREVDLVKDVLAHCEDLFTRHGGHPMAAGFEMPHENLTRLQDRLERLGEESLADLDVASSLYFDAEVPLEKLPGETFRWLKRLEPFGVDNPTPAFLTRNLRPVGARPVGRQGQHLRLKLKEDRMVWDAMAFRMWDRWVPDTPLLDVVYNIGIDWRGGTEVLGLTVLDFRPSSS